jgi:uncharacterized membrane protein
MQIILFILGIIYACACMILSFLLSVLAMLLEPLVLKYRKVYKVQLNIEHASEVLYEQAMKFAKPKRK